MFHQIKSIVHPKSQITKTKQEINRTFGLNETYQDSRNDEILKDIKDSNK